ncbi:MAG: hypothetical protein ACRC5A_00535 [Enterobacteriaceae bacterium]
MPLNEIPQKVCNSEFSDSTAEILMMETWADRIPDLIDDDVMLYFRWLVARVFILNHKALTGEEIFVHTIGTTPDWYRDTLTLMPEVFAPNIAPNPAPNSAPNNGGNTGSNSEGIKTSNSAVPHEVAGGIPGGNAGGNDGEVIRFPLLPHYERLGLYNNIECPLIAMFGLRDGTRKAIECYIKMLTPSGITPVSLSEVGYLMIAGLHIEFLNGLDNSEVNHATLH